MFSRKPKAPKILERQPNPYGTMSVDMDENGNPVGWVRFGSQMNDRDAETEVVGESFYREKLLYLIRTCERSDRRGPGRLLQHFALQRDPGNPHDANAVKVLAWPSDDPVGWLPRDVAARVAPVLDRMLANGAERFMCRGVILWEERDGGPFKNPEVPVGVRLDLVASGKADWTSPEFSV